MMLGSTRWLYDRGCKLIPVHPKKAERIARELIRRRYTGGLEILARLQLQAGNLDDAISTLDEATTEHPQIAIFWSLLGEAHSNIGNYEDALAAFQRHRMFSEEAEVADYNIGIVYARMGQHDLALQFLMRDEWEDLPRRLGMVARAHSLRKIGRNEEARAVLESFAREEWDARFWGEFAALELADGRTEKAVAAAKTSVGLGSSWEALEVLRSQAPPVSADTREWKLVLHGVRRDHGLGFYRRAVIVADSEEEALQLARFALNVEELEVDEVAENGPTSLDRKGPAWIDELVPAYRLKKNRRNP